MQTKSCWRILTLTLVLSLMVSGAVFGQSAVPQRSEIPDEYKWNLSDIYPDWQSWEQGMADLERMMGEFENLKGTLANGPENVYKAYKLYDDMDVIAYRVIRYSGFQFALNTRDNEAAARSQQFYSLYAKFGTATAWLTPELLAIGWDTMSKWLDEYKPLAPYRHPISDAFRQHQHVLDEEKERLLSYYNLLRSSPDDAYTALSTADIKYRDVTLSDGSTVTLTPGNYRGILTNNGNQADRAAAFETYYATYSDNANSYAALYNGVLQADWANTQARNYGSCLEAGLDDYNVPVEVIENLIAAVKRGLEPLHRFHELRKKALGLDTYHNYDGSYPIVDFHKTYEYDDAVKWITESVAPLGKEYQDKVKEAFASRWVDVYETPNKTTGAFSGGCYGVHPFILMNYNKTMDNVFTLAHEMGHAMHSVLSEQNQPKAISDYTLLGAEVASAVNEGLLMDYLLKNSKDPLERTFLLLRAIEDLEGTFYTQVQFAEFEVEAHRMVERGEPITAESLSELYDEIAKEYRGDVVTPDSLYRYTWTRISHFYDVPYYVYQYAASFSAAAQLMNDIKSDDQKLRQDALDRYLTYLKSGGNDYPIELMKKAGADLTDPATFDAVIAHMDKLVTQLEQEMAKL
ncbi:MAG: oligoendopeptidase F [Candidatus Zixiibacteriota bacterium]